MFLVWYRGAFVSPFGSMKLNAVVRESSSSVGLSDDKATNGEGGEGRTLEETLDSPVQSEIQSETKDNIAEDISQRKSILEKTMVDGLDLSSKGANENHQLEDLSYTERLKIWHVPKTPTAVLSEANNNVIHEKDEMCPSPLSYTAEIDTEKEAQEEDNVPNAFRSYKPDKPSKSLLPSKNIMKGTYRRTPPPLIKDKIEDPKSPLGIAPIYEQPDQPVVHIPSNLLFSESAATLTHAENSPNYTGRDDCTRKISQKDRNVIVIAPEEPPASMCQDEPMDLSKTGPGLIPESRAKDDDGVLDLSRSSKCLSVTEKLLLKHRPNAQTPPLHKVNRQKPKARHSAPSKYSHNVPSGPSTSHNAPISPSSSRSSTPSKKGETTTDPSSYWSPLWNPYMAAYSHYMNMALLSGGNKTQTSPGSSTTPIQPLQPGASVTPLPFPPPSLKSPPSSSAEPRHAPSHIKEESMSDQDMDESDCPEDFAMGEPGPSGGPSSNRKRGKSVRSSSMGGGNLRVFSAPHSSTSSAFPSLGTENKGPSVMPSDVPSEMSTSTEAIAACVMRWAPTHVQGSTCAQRSYVPKQAWNTSEDDGEHPY